MRRCARFLGLVLSLAAPGLVPLQSSSAYADSYTIYHIGNGNSEQDVGLTDSGVAVLYGLDNCGMGATSYCYSTFSQGVLTNVSFTLPALPFDSGSLCSTSVPGGYVAGPDSVCNGGYAGVGASPTNGGTNSLLGGPIGALSLIAPGPVLSIAVDGSGDILWLNGSLEENFEAIDLTSRTVAPEPSTLALLGTGCVGLAGAMRRKLRRC